MSTQLRATKILFTALILLNAVACRSANEPPDGAELYSKGSETCYTKAVCCSEGNCEYFEHCRSDDSSDFRFTGMAESAVPPPSQ